MSVDLAYTVDLAYIVYLAYLVDLIIGDPSYLPHPVIYIGKAIELLEKLLRATLARIIGLKGAGVILTLIITGGALVGTYGLLVLAARWSALASTALSVWLISTTLAAKSLAKAGMEIFDLLHTGNLSEARRKVGWIVGRDTENLSPEEITRATIETVAENMVDAIIAPLFYAFMGGAPLAMAYRAVNTLDSMVGYKNEKYLKFGWASARLDDLCNLIPSRVTGLLIALGAWLLGFPGRRALKTICRDARKHPSPNSGFPEAGVAGALGIRLGGLNYYGGKASFRAYMGDELRPLEPGDINKTKKLMYIVSGLAATLGLLVTFAWR